MQISDEMVEKAARVLNPYAWNMPGEYMSRQVSILNARSALKAALSTDAGPVKTPFEVASKHIPEGRVSLLSRAIRQGLNDYGWKNFGTLPEVLMGYIFEAERAEEAVHGEPVKTAPAVAVKALKMADETFRDLGWHDKYEATTAALSALSTQVQDVAGEEKAECFRTAMLEVESRIRSVRVRELPLGQPVDDNACFLSEIADILKNAREKFSFSLPASPASKQGDDK